MRNPVGKNRVGEPATIHTEKNVSCFSVYVVNMYTRMCTHGLVISLMALPLHW